MRRPSMPTSVLVTIFLGLIKLGATQNLSQNVYRSNVASAGKSLF